MRAYLARHPEGAPERRTAPTSRGCATAATTGEVADPAPGWRRWPRSSGATRRPSRRAAALERPAGAAADGALGDMFARAAEVEPLIGDLWTETTRPLVPPFFSAVSVARCRPCTPARRPPGSPPPDC